MNLHKQLAILTAAMFATLIGPLVFAKTPFQTVEFSFSDEGIYIGCLGESVDVHTSVTVRYREFETPSGNYHYVDDWRFDSEWVGVLTGWTWLSKGHSTGVINDGSAYVEQWTGHEMAFPVTGDGPKFRYNQLFKLTVNAKGELKVLKLPPEDINDLIRCLGPGN